MSSDACSAYTASRGALILKNGVKIAETAVSGGKIEKEGPLGGLLDVFAGDIPRAPESWQRLGLEWLYRLIREPKRFRRMKPSSWFTSKDSPT